MKIDDEYVVIGGFIAILVAIFVAIMAISNCIDVSKWNNGHCSCGGNWEYVQAVGHYSSTTYMYECDKCGTVEEFNEYR